VKPLTLSVHELEPGGRHGVDEHSCQWQRTEQTDGQQWREERGGAWTTYIDFAFAESARIASIADARVCANTVETL
jgi:hypothetical protein